MSTEGAGRTAVRVGLVSVLLLSASCMPSSEDLSPERRQAIRDSVGTFLDDWVDRIEALDVDGIAGFYSADEAFRWIEDGRVRYRSRDEVGASLGGLEAQLSGLDFRWESRRIDPVGPGAAVVTGIFDQTFEFRGGGGFGFRGAVSAVVRHEPGGWRFLVGHTSTAPEEERGGGG